MFAVLKNKQVTTTKRIKMKMIYPSTLALVAGTILLSGVSARASDTDNRIESSAANSYMFKTTLKDDSIKTESKDGVVTLTETVADESQKSMAENTVASLPGVV